MQKPELPKTEQCLNCGHEVVQCKYCPECGQENIDYRVKSGLLIRYYLHKNLRFDVKWIITIKNLLFRPWHLTEAYLQGKRKQYTHPFRLYLVLSVLFFLGIRLQVNSTIPDNSPKSIKFMLFDIKTENEVNMQKVLQQVMAQLPNAMLVSVPLVAFVLTLLYYRKAEYLFFDHFILMLHYYAFVYLISLPFLFIPYIRNFSVVSILIASVFLWLLMKRFYKESTLMTTLKYVLFSLFSTAIILILSVVLVIGIIFKEVIIK